MSARGVGFALLVLVGCEEGEPPECELSGESTCSSTLVVERAESDDSNFVLVLRSEAEELDLQIQCPTPPNGETSAGTITWFCGAGQITLVRTDDWPDTLEVGFGGGFPTTVTPDYSPGLDLCGNLCNNGMITL